MSTLLTRERHFHNSRLRVTQFTVSRDRVGSTRRDRWWPLQIQSEQSARLLYHFLVAFVSRVRWRSSRYGLGSGPDTLSGDATQKWSVFVN